MVHYIYELIRGRMDILTLLLVVLTYCVIALVVFPARGFAQAWAANKLGDPTARYEGRMTMNPKAHMDVFGILALFIVGIGFVKPIPVRYEYFRKPRRDYILTLLAGPAIGLLFGFCGMLLFRVCAFFVTSAKVLTLLYLLLVEVFAMTNITLAIFTLLPLPFLDGYLILSMFLPSKWVYTIRQYGTYISLGMLLLIFSGALSPLIGFLAGLVTRLFSVILFF